MSRQKFQATLEREANRLNWTLIRVPAKVSKTWGRRGLIRVKGSINGFAFRTSLFPDGKGSHVLVVNKQMQKGSGTCPGSSAVRSPPARQPGPSVTDNGGKPRKLTLGASPALKLADARERAGEALRSVAS